MKTTLAEMELLIRQEVHVCDSERCLSVLRMKLCPLNSIHQCRRLPLLLHSHQDGAAEALLIIASLSAYKKSYDHGEYNLVAENLPSMQMALSSIPSTE